jgi:hypothetical protein
MAKKEARDVASFAELLGPGGLVGFFNPDDPKVKKQRERAAKKVEREFSKLLNAFHEAEEEKKRAKLLRKLATSGESP